MISWYHYGIPVAPCRSTFRQNDIEPSRQFEGLGYGNHCPGTAGYSWVTQGSGTDPIHWSYWMYNLPNQAIVATIFSRHVCLTFSVSQTWIDPSG